MKKIIISLLLAMGLSTSSYAIGLEGLSVGASIATAGFYAVGTESSDNDPLGVDDTKQAGAFQDEYGSIFIEYNLGSLSLGLDYVPSVITTPSNTNIQGSVVNTVQGEFENHTTLYALIPIPLGGLYVKAGGIYVDINSLENLGTGGSYGNVDTLGFTAGLGWSHEAVDGISIRAEVLAAKYDSVSATNTAGMPGGTQVTLDDMMSASGRISLVKTF